MKLDNFIADDGVKIICINPEAIPIMEKKLTDFAVRKELEKR